MKIGHVLAGASFVLLGCFLIGATKIPPPAGPVAWMAEVAMFAALLWGMLIGRATR